MSKMNSEFIYIGYYIDGIELCVHSSKKKVEKYMSITRNLDHDDYYIIKLSYDKIYQFTDLYLTTEYDRIYTYRDIHIIEDMYHDTIDQLANAYNILKDNKIILNESCIDKSIDKLKPIVSDKKWNDSKADIRYEIFRNNLIYKMDIYSYLNLVKIYQEYNSFYF